MIVKHTKQNKEHDDQLLFETKTVIDEKEFKKFQKFYLNKFKSSLLPKLIIIFLAILSLILAIIRRSPSAIVLIIAFMILYPTLLTITLNVQIKKIYQSNMRINMLEETLSFYEDHFISQSKYTHYETKYSDIYKLCETKDNFYIFLSDNQSFILIKKNIDNLEKFTSFIKQKGPYKKYR